MQRKAQWLGVLVLSLGIAGAAPYYRDPPARPASSPEIKTAAQSPQPAEVLPVAEMLRVELVRTSSGPTEMIPGEQKPAPPPLIQLPSWTGQSSPPVSWDAPPPPPENPYSSRQREFRPPVKIIEPTRPAIRPITRPQIRRHRVVDGDDLRLLSLRYFGDETHVEAILQANASVISSRELLPVGKELVIPPR